MAKRAHPQHGFRSCLGVLSLMKKYETRLEAACKRAVEMNALSYQSVKNILQNGLDQQPLTPVAQVALPLHENIRGADYYQ